MSVEVVPLRDGKPVDGESGFLLGGQRRAVGLAMNSDIGNTVEPRILSDIFTAT
jgi:hypothetical protein